LRISALLLTGGHERRRLILANLTAEPTRARIACGGLLEGRRLHSSNALVATTDPEAFCDAPFEQLENPLVLPPYAIAFLDLA
jgi:hypothetical protein